MNSKSEFSCALQEMMCQKKKQILSLLILGGALLSPLSQASSSDVTYHLNGNAFEWVSLRTNVKWTSDSFNTTIDSSGTTHIQWSFNPSNVDPKITPDQAVDITKKAMSNWESVCNVKFDYQGYTTASPTNSADFKFTIGFVDPSKINQDAVAQATVAITQMSGSSSDYMILGADVEVIHTFSSFTDPSKTFISFQGVMTHELGHVLGLNHSNVMESVMYIPYVSLEYQATLRQDDIDGCVAKYGKSLTPKPFVYTSLDTQPKQVASLTPSVLSKDSVLLFDGIEPGGIHKLIFGLRLQTTPVISNGQFRFLVAYFDSKVYVYNRVTQLWTVVPDPFNDTSIGHAVDENVSNNGVFSQNPGLTVSYPSGVGLKGTTLTLGVGSSLKDMLTTGMYSTFYTIQD